MKTEELVGATLDCWVAKANGMTATLLNGDCVLPMRTHGEMHYRPSLVWSEGGSVIEHESIALSRHGMQWEAQCPSSVSGSTVTCQGPTHLIAAMRAFVKAKFGDELEDDVFVEMHPMPRLSRDNGAGYANRAR